MKPRVPCDKRKGNFAYSRK